MSLTQKDPTDVLGTPLTKWLSEDLSAELDERIAALFLRYDIGLSCDCSNWDESVRQLAVCLASYFAPWLRLSFASVDVWSLVIDLCTEFVDGFRLHSEIPRPGARSVYKNHEMEIADTFQAVKDIMRWSDERISELLTAGPDGVYWGEIPDQLKGICLAFRREILSGARTSTPELSSEKKRANQRKKNEPELIMQTFAARNGYLRREICMNLQSIPSDALRKRKIATLCAEWRNVWQLSGKYETRGEQPKAKTSSLVNELLKYQLSKPVDDTDTSRCI
jgi:hypothetical protein